MYICCALVGTIKNSVKMDLNRNGMVCSGVGLSGSG
jgi:hypothetical protein